MELNQQELPHIVVGTLMEVHKELGPGLLAEAYRACLAHELRNREIIYERNSPVSLDYKGCRVASAFLFDFVIEDMIALSIFSVHALESRHREVLRNYLQISGLEIGFLVNFNVSDLRKGGLKRLIVSDDEPNLPWKRVDPSSDSLEANFDT